jgi:hypothetical protein
MGDRGFAWLRWGIVAATLSSVPVHSVRAQDDDPARGSQASLRGTYDFGPSQPSTGRPDAQDVDDDAAPGIPPPVPPVDPTSETQEQDSLEPAS